MQTIVIEMEKVSYYGITELPFVGKFKIRWTLHCPTFTIECVLLKRHFQLNKTEEDDYHIPLFLDPHTIYNVSIKNYFSYFQRCVI